MKKFLTESEIPEKELYNKLEAVEKKAWIDIYKSASPKTAAGLGLKYRSLDSAGLTISASADVLALNRVLGFESEYELTNELLTEIIKEYKNSSIPRFFLQIQPGLLTEANIKKLNFSGFTHYNNWSKLYRDDSPVKEIKSDLITDQVGKPGAKYFADILIKSFEWNEKLYAWFFDFVERDNWIHYLAYFKNEPIAAASLFIDGVYGWLGFAATLKEFRKLGAQHAMIRQRLLDGINSGVKHFIVETAENTPEKKSQSFLNLFDMDFRLAYQRPNFIFTF